MEKRLRQAAFCPGAVREKDKRDIAALERILEQL